MRFLYVKYSVLHVTSDDSFNQVLSIDIHRQHLVVLTAHNHVTLTTLDTGIECILLLTTQPREVAAAYRELLETRPQESR